MKVEKKATGRGNFAKKGEDIKDGDIIEILDEGEKAEGQWGLQDVFLIKTAGGEEKNVNVNQTSMNNLIDAYGDETKEWIGKKAKAWILTQNVSGTFRKVLYFTHPDRALDDDMDDVNAEAQTAKEGVAKEGDGSF